MNKVNKAKQNIQDQPNPAVQSSQSQAQAAQQQERQDKQDRQDKLEGELQVLKAKLKQAQEKEKRALADYQNLLRRTQEQRARLIKMAGKNLIASLLPALDNLQRAAQQIDDDGLNLVNDQLWQALKAAGLEKIQAKGQEFNVNTMEAVDNRDKEGKQKDQDQQALVVQEVVKPGYKLKGEVIQHAKVILGSAQGSSAESSNDSSDSEGETA
jgi:molecular chaperone GrpE